VHFVTGERFALLISEVFPACPVMFAAARGDLPGRAGFAAGDSVAMLFFCEQTNAGEGISLDPQGSATGTAPQTTGKPAAKQNPVQSARPGDIACGPSDEIEAVARRAQA
jgi:hypothetical protein